MKNFIENREKKKTHDMQGRSHVVSPPPTPQNCFLKNTLKISKIRTHSIFFKGLAPPRTEFWPPPPTSHSNLASKIPILHLFCQFPFLNISYLCFKKREAFL